MKNCPYCDLPIMDEAIICEHCRASLIEPIKPKTKKCVFCGREILADSTLCQYCGMSTIAFPQKYLPLLVYSLWDSSRRKPIRKFHNPSILDYPILNIKLQDGVLMKDRLLEIGVYDIAVRYSYDPPLNGYGSGVMTFNDLSELIDRGAGVIVSAKSGRSLIIHSVKRRVESKNYVDPDGGEDWEDGEDDGYFDADINTRHKGEDWEDWENWGYESYEEWEESLPD